MQSGCTECGSRKIPCRCRRINTKSTRTEIINNEGNRTVKVDTIIHEKDLYFNPHEIIDEARSKLADKVVGYIWDKIQPALDKSLYEVFNENSINSKSSN